MKILRPQKTYTWILILFALLFVAFGLWSIREFHTVSAWPLTVACILLVMILLLWLLPSSSYLQFDEDALTIRHLFKSSHYHWDDIQKFWADRRITGQLGVYYMLNGNRVMQVHYLPDNYGMKPRELAVLLNQWRLHISEELEEADTPPKKKEDKPPKPPSAREEETVLLSLGMGQT
ncbi:MAG: hypothetical protein JW849_08515 [Phycisphaerae bacterium]|nr:hypothetical protein [Phycisphaerae bacterium]